jgi:chemotaxis protein CheD
MKVLAGSSSKGITLMRGDHCVSDKEVIISTILGSCVSACLYDPLRRIVGMNHFLLSGEGRGKGLPLWLSDAGRYGVNAMELIINGMLRLGAEKKNLRAKVFGGASQFSEYSGGDNLNSVGEVNSRFILEFLENEGVKLVAANLGGNQGRVIHFHSKDFSVYQRKIRKTVMPDLITKEKRFLKQVAAKRYAEPELWE